MENLLGGKKVEDNIVLSSSLMKLSDELDALLYKYDICDFSIFIGENNSLNGIVWTEGNIRKSISGIRVMISDIARSNNLDEEEVINMIRENHPEDINKVSESGQNAGQQHQ